MSLERACRDLRDRGRKPLVPFVTAGFPDTRTSIELLVECARRGCDVVEIGVPFSDPVADGPVIQRASQIALDRGMTLTGALDVVREVSREPVQPVVMTYLNPVLRFGYGAFARAAAEAGCRGVIVPDLSGEDSGPLRSALAGEGICLVDLVAPTTPDARLAGIADRAAGFLYLVAVTGVTGLASADGDSLAAYAARVRAHTDLPLYVGFGIDSAERARAAVSAADGAIVGSALLRPLLSGGNVATVLELVDAMLAAIGGAAVTPRGP